MVKPSLASAAALVVSRPLELVSLMTLTVTVFGSAGVAFFSASAGRVADQGVDEVRHRGGVHLDHVADRRVRCRHRAVGMVVKVTLPAVRFCICSASLVGSSVWSIVSDDGDRLEQVLQLERVEQGAAGDQLAEHRGQEVLLALDPVQVAVGQAVPLPDEGQRLLALDDVVALLQVDAGVADAVRRTGVVGARVRVAACLVQADVDAADGVGDPVEAEQVDLDEVVDAQAGQVADGLRPAARRRPALLPLPSLARRPGRRS